jgi:hypothetical protein
MEVSGAGKLNNEQAEGLNVTLKDVSADLRL